jgi:hypothetical protein
MHPSPSRIRAAMLLLTALTLPGIGSAAPTSAPDPPTETSATDEGARWQLNPPDRFWRLRLVPELGFLAPVHHTITLSRDGTTFDYLEEGGQDNLFLYLRAQAELEFIERINLVLLYQPIDVRSKVALLTDHRFDGFDYPAGTPVDLRYGFSYWRLSVYYDFYKAPDRELGIGLSGQIRNATIDFSTADGTVRVTKRDVGFVPIIKLRGRYTFPSGVFLGAEVDGFYARGKGIVGRTTVEPSFEGLILDAALRGGMYLAPVGDLFLSVRYIGGGSRGTSTREPPPGDGYVSNWIHTLNLSMGLVLR